MKKIFYILIISIISLTSCKETIDLEPMDRIVDSAIWPDENLVNAYIANIYESTDFIERKGDYRYSGAFCVPVMGGECRLYGAKEETLLAKGYWTNESISGSRIDYWKWNLVRDLNVFIEHMQDNPNFTPEYNAQKVAEARFLRSWIFFQMVERFGGLPIINKVVPILASEEEIYPKRNTEDECYEFIIKEMEEISPVLPEDQVKGVPSRWAALALQSRAALFAASIAEFGTMQLDSLLGIPKDKKTYYAQISYDASKAIIDSGKHPLYKKHQDPAANYYNLFIDESSDNKEPIFVEVFDYSKNKSHGRSHRQCPHDLSDTFASCYFLYDFIELYEFNDGRPGTSISRTDLESKEYSSEELFGNREPRFHASVFYPECSFKGGKAYFHKWTVRDGKELKSGVAEDGWPYAAHPRNSAKTGFMVKKCCNENIKTTDVLDDDTDYIVFRTGEIYLNLSEAAYYLGKTDESLDAVNTIRNRAGMPNKDHIDIKVIQHERMIELAFENQSYFDLRRWRIMKEWMNGKDFVGLQFIYNYNTKKYQIKVAKQDGMPRLFEERHYYLPLGIKHIAENPNLVENPGW